MSTNEIDEEDDSWYEQMADYAANNYHDDDYDGFDIAEATKDATEMIEEDTYFQQVQDMNCELTDQQYKSEDNYIWQSIARDLVNDSSKSNKTENDFKKWKEIIPSHSSSVMLLQQWLFSHLPHTIKLLNTLQRGEEFFKQNSIRIFVDDILHPSMASFIKYIAPINLVECSIYTPYHASKVDITPFVQSLISLLCKFYPKCEIELVATKTDFFEQVISSLPHIKIDWVNYCHTYLLQSNLASIKQHEITLPDGYAFRPLQEKDAVMINDTWKYKSDHSIHLVQDMIASQQGMGIVCQDVLVAWCLVYNYGAIGMLYTLPNHRGKGLACQVVQKVIQQLFANSQNFNPPYCYIEQSNDISKRIFSRLGFEKVDEVVWSGISFP